MDASRRWSLFLLVLSFYCASILSWRCSKKGFESEDKQPPSHALIPQDTVWQPVKHTNNQFFVYSAFVEIRHFVGVRVLGITARPPRDQVFCRMWLADDRILTLGARIQVIKEHGHLKYSAVYVHCDFGDNSVQRHETEEASLAVIASKAYDRPPTNLLKNTLHVCVKPFHYTYDQVEWMIEWIEMNRMLGVSHFYMYNDSLSDQMSCLLSHYQRQGLITLLPWDIPESISHSSVIRIRGQFVAFNDCLYRSMSKAGWLMIIDTDELVIPQQYDKLTTMLDTLARKWSLNSSLTGFYIKNFFFFRGWEDDPLSSIPLITSRKTRRTFGNRIPTRSKYIVRPLDVIDPGNHFINKAVDGARTEIASDEQAKLHHYRINHTDVKYDLYYPVSVVDRTAHRWIKNLWETVKTERQNIQCLKINN